MSCAMPRVLCVDDEPKNLKLLEAMLLPRGYDIVFASNGQEALEKIKTEQIDLCLLDVMMPGIDGFEVCRRIKSDDRYRTIPVVMITSYTGSIHRTLGIEAGAEDFISKPFERFEVLARIKMLLEVKSLNDQLNAARESADRSLRMAKVSRIKSDFLANMSHELFTPLNAVIGFSTVLHMESYGLINEKQRECVSHIISGGNRLQELITGIIEFTRTKSDTVELELSTFPLRELLDDSLLMYRENALEKGIDLHLDLCAESDGDITADKRKLMQILTNLLSNALKFSPAGASVRVTALRNDSSIVIAVADTGIGIKQDDIPNLFQILTQMEPAYSKVYTGIGLGLVLAGQFVKEHGGKIWAESEFGKGSVFSFTIPLRRCPTAGGGGRGCPDEAG